MNSSAFSSRTSSISSGLSSISSLSFSPWAAASVCPPASPSDPPSFFWTRLCSCDMASPYGPLIVAGGTRLSLQRLQEALWIRCLLEQLGDVRARAPQRFPHWDALQRVLPSVEDQRIPGRCGDRVGVPVDAPAAEVRASVPGRFVDGTIGLLVGDEAFDLARRSQLVVEAL